MNQSSETRGREPAPTSCHLSGTDLWNTSATINSSVSAGGAVAAASIVRGFNGFEGNSAGEVTKVKLFEELGFLSVVRCGCPVSACNIANWMFRHISSVFCFFLSKKQKQVLSYDSD